MEYCEKCKFYDLGVCCNLKFDGENRQRNQDTVACAFFKEREEEYQPVVIDEQKYACVVFPVENLEEFDSFVTNSHFREDERSSWGVFKGKPLVISLDKLFLISRGIKEAKRVIDSAQERYRLNVVKDFVDFMLKKGSVDFFIHRIENLKARHYKMPSQNNMVESIESRQDGDFCDACPEKGFTDCSCKRDKK